MMSGYWMSPHTLDCYAKIVNTDQVLHGRQAPIPSIDIIKHIVQRDDMVFCIILNYFVFSIITHMVIF